MANTRIEEGRQPLPEVSDLTRPVLERRVRDAFSARGLVLWLSNIRRKRTGCLTCRERRVRCGEEKPVCKNCSRKSRPCKWSRDGDKFRHHFFNNSDVSEQQLPLTEITDDVPASIINCDHISLTPSASFSSTATNKQDAAVHLPTPTASTASIADELDGRSNASWQAATSSDSNQASRSNSLFSPATSNALSADELSCWRSEVLQSFNEDPPSLNIDHASSICRSQSARLKQCIDLEHESPIPPNLEPNAELFSDWHSLGASDTVVEALSGDQEMRLLQVYLQECAHWFDALDGQRHYARKDVARMMTCPPWRAAALALSAKHIELTQSKIKFPDSLSLHLYQLAVQLAIDSISGRFDCIGTTAGCVILAVYEMMTVTYHNWRRHLQGCTSIYSHNHWNGDSTGLIRASFWNYARIDVWAAFCTGTETMLSTEKWFNHPEKMLQYPCVDVDRHAHIAVWLLARSNNLIHCTKHNTDLSVVQEITLLKTDLARFKRLTPTIAKPVMQIESPQPADDPFPSVLFSSESSAIASILWHTARLLLLDYESRKQGLRVESMEIYEHSRFICGVIETHKHSSSVLVEAIHPLWICGGHLRTKSEKFAVLELLARIERVIGWKTAWRADSLHKKWDLG